MAHPKPLLIPWLRDQIDSGQYPGVRWTNSHNNQFSIPWKHGLRQDSCDKDILIFKAWAEVSGNGHAQGNASVWKRNFRSALRAKGFKLASDMKKDDTNPHKVFDWPEETAAVGGDKSSGSIEQDDGERLEDMSQSQFVTCLDDDLYCSDSTALIAKQDILQECLKGLNIGPEAEDSAGFHHHPPPPPPEQQQLHSSTVIGAHALPGQQQYPVMFPEQPAHPMEGDVGGATDEQFVAQFRQTMSKTSDGEHFKTQFRVTVYYRGVKVLQQLVENEAGLCLVYRPEFVGTVYDENSGLTMVTLPPPVSMLDQTQASLTQTILEKVGDGVEIGVSGYVVYSQRRGDSRAFWSFSKFDESACPQEVSKLEPQPLYPLKDFIQGIKDFTEGGLCPPSSLFLCLGEKWPDPHKRPWVKKLITVEVVLTSLELLTNMAVVGGASSLQSVELQLSLDEMMEVC